MKKYFILIVILLLSILSSTAQSKEHNQRLVRENGNLYVSANGHKYLVEKSLVTVKPKKEVEPDKSYKIANTSQFGFWDLEVPEGVDVEDYSETLKASGLFETVEYVTECEFFFEPNDPLIMRQWHIEKLHLRDVWDRTTGSSQVKIGIIDTGIDRDHEDLGFSSYGNYTNVSHSKGWDYIDNCQYATPTDQHGTYVAIVAGAKTNNGFYGAGVAGGNNGGGSTLISYRVRNSLHVRNAIYQAVSDGANIINCSFGIFQTASLDSAIVYAYNNNVPIVCAAGNENDSSINYPASHSLTIAVGSTNSEDERCDFSNYGSGLDVMAPGEMIALEGTNYNYICLNGTSLSAPMVSGTIALMLSVNPNLTAAEIREILRKTASKGSIYSYGNNGWNPEMGYGLLNPRAAVSLASNLEITGPNSITDSIGIYKIDNLSSDFDVVWTISDSYFNSNYLIQDTPVYNQCTIRRSSTQGMINATLTAQIYYDGMWTELLTKSGISTTPYIFPGTYHNGQVTKTINLPLPLDAIPGSLVTITSPKLVGASVSQVGGNITPTYWYFNSTAGILYVGFPSSLGTIVIRVLCSDGSTYNLPVTTVSNTNQLALSYDNNYLEVSLVEQIDDSFVGDYNFEEAIEKTKRLIEARNVLTGEKIYEQHLNGKSCLIDTSNWKPGVYVIRAIIGSEIISQKIAVK